MFYLRKQNFVIPNYRTAQDFLRMKNLGTYDLSQEASVWSDIKIGASFGIDDTVLKNMLYSGFHEIQFNAPGNHYWREKQRERYRHLWKTKKWEMRKRRIPKIGILAHCKGFSAETSLSTTLHRAMYFFASEFNCCISGFVIYT